MQKIPTLYIRDKQDPSRVTREVDPDCKWVIDGEGTATEKFDGSACLVHCSELYRRHRVKPGKAKPPGWIHWNFEEPAGSGHGWAPVNASTSDQYHREAWDNCSNTPPAGTYELVGPSQNGNPHSVSRHKLRRHGFAGPGALVNFSKVPTGYDDLEDWLRESRPMEGIVWHHPDGRMAKIKRRDFHLRWPDGSAYKS